MLIRALIVFIAIQVALLVVAFLTLLAMDFAPAASWIIAAFVVVVEVISFAGLLLDPLTSWIRTGKSD